MVLKLPRLKTSDVIVDKDGKPITFLTRFWDQFASQIESNISGIQSALAAAGIANTAATAANAAAAAANAAAAAATASGASAALLQSLIDSGVNGSCTIGAFDAGTDATVTISANTRYYSGGPVASVAVNAGSVTGVAYGLDSALIFYDDPTRAGGAVTYQVTIDPLLATPTPAHPNRHYIGSVPTPSALDPPNVGSPNFYAP